MNKMWKGICVAAALVAVTGVVDAVQQQSAGTRREPQFENGEVRVWKSIIMPNQPLSLHRHDHGRTIVTLKGGTLDVVDAKGATKQKMVWETGKAYWLDADPPDTQHGDQNRGTEPMEVIVVELKNDVKRCRSRLPTPDSIYSPPRPHSDTAATTRPRVGSGGRCSTASIRRGSCRDTG